MRYDLYAYLFKMFFVKNTIVVDIYHCFQMSNVTLAPYPRVAHCARRRSERQEKKKIIITLSAFLTDYILSYHDQEQS